MGHGGGVFVFEVYTKFFGHFELKMSKKFKWKMLRRYLVPDESSSLEMGIRASSA